MKKKMQSLLLSGLSLISASLKIKKRNPERIRTGVGTAFHLHPHHRVQFSLESRILTIIYNLNFL
ncbi:hypothetical protein IW15_12935 [Chryseobacterium soli]|uniref:Uncharacterized protein n=1 Tax=Chryseobacterium soli TaxID=445961 RepID=A0A086A6Y2_9FLAO|nr:hypothetical protein [Chryseobacterium soli]KFF12446.1 hypothetical protein IW15_12935 [Chryseobacterium soli]